MILANYEMKLKQAFENLKIFWIVIIMYPIYNLHLLLIIKKQFKFEKQWFVLQIFLIAIQLQLEISNCKTKKNIFEKLLLINIIQILVTQSIW